MFNDSKVIAAVAGATIGLIGGFIGLFGTLFALNRQRRMKVMDLEHSEKIAQINIEAQRDLARGKAESEQQLLSKNIEAQRALEALRAEFDLEKHSLAAALEESKYTLTSMDQVSEAIQRVKHELDTIILRGFIPINEKFYREASRVIAAASSHMEDAYAKQEARLPDVVRDAVHNLKGSLQGISSDVAHQTHILNGRVPRKRIADHIALIKQMRDDLTKCQKMLREVRPRVRDFQYKEYEDILSIPLEGSMVRLGSIERASRKSLTK